MLRAQQNIHSKKGQIWVSAALYTALGLILITVILSVGMPFVNKIKDRNTVLQTKEILFKMDELIREVELQGIGSRRPLLVDIQEGDFIIDEGSKTAKGGTISWTFISKNKLGIESGDGVGVKGPLIQEGSLNIQSTKVGQGFEIKLWLDYKPYNIDIGSVLKQVSGQFELVVEHRQWSQTDVDKELVNIVKLGDDYVNIKEA